MDEKMIAMCATIRHMVKLEEEKRETLKKLIVAIGAERKRKSTDGTLGTMDEWENERMDMLVLAGLEKDTRFGYFNRSSKRLKDRLERLERKTSVWSEARRKNADGS